MRITIPNKFKIWINKNSNKLVKNQNYPLDQKSQGNNPKFNQKISNLLVKKDKSHATISTKTHLRACFKDHFCKVIIK
jgi:hypothetical protein